MIKGHQREKYNIEECLSNFLFYYNDRVHLMTKVAPYVAMMNARDKQLLKKLEKILLTEVIVRNFWQKIIKKNFQ